MTEPSSSVKDHNPNTPDRAELLGLYKTAIEEYRFEVSLGWERQKFFVGLNVSLLAASAGFAKLGADGGYDALLAVALFAIAATAVVGIFIIRKSHLYYRNTRAHFQWIEERLGYVARDLALQTTPGMKEGHNVWPRLGRVRTVVLTIAVLGLLPALESAMASHYLLTTRGGDTHAEQPVRDGQCPPCAVGHATGDSRANGYCEPPHESGPRRSAGWRRSPARFALSRSPISARSIRPKARDSTRFVWPHGPSRASK